MILTLKHRFTCDSFNLTYVVNCVTSKKYTGEMRKENLN